MGGAPPAKARQKQVNAILLCVLDPWNVPTPRGMYQAPVERNIVRAALGSGPGSRAGPGPCKWPVSYIYVCIFYTNLRYFIPKDN